MLPLFADAGSSATAGEGEDFGRGGPSKKYCENQAKAGKYYDMVHTALNPGTVGEHCQGRDEFVKAYQFMLLARILDDKFASLFRWERFTAGFFWAAARRR